MSSLVENRACLDTGRSVHFRDFTWKKNASWKLYKGYCMGDLGMMREVIVKVPVNDIWTEEDCIREIDKIQQIKDMYIAFSRDICSNYKINIAVPKKAVIDRTAGVHNMKFRRRSLSRDEWVLIVDKMENRQTFANREGESTNNSTDVLDAFVHYTFDKSRGSSVVNKPTGVEAYSGHLLSSPSMLTKRDDVMKIMQRHTCNYLCRGMLMPQDLIPSAAEQYPQVPVQPSAPPANEFDGDVVAANGLSKDEHLIQFAVQMDSTNQYHAIPYNLHPGPAPNYGPNCSMYGQYFDQPPAYSSHCPAGHREVLCGSMDGNGNFVPCQPWNQGDILLVGDSARVQQASVASLGLS